MQVYCIQVSAISDWNMETTICDWNIETICDWNK
jgi:hypothetical protein